MKRLCRWAIILIVLILVAAILSLWLSKQRPAISVAIAPGLIASLFCFRLVHERKQKTAQGNTLSLDPGQKIDAIISLADRAHAETMRYREHVWKVVAWTVALLAATLTAAQASKMTQAMPYWKEICASFAVFVTVCGIRDVFFDYYQFVVNRNWQRRCERLLKFFEKDAYLTSESLLPKGWGEEDYRLRDCIAHLIQWWIVIYAVAVYSIFSIL